MSESAAASSLPSGENASCFSKGSMIKPGGGRKLGTDLIGCPVAKFHRVIV